MGGGTDVAPGDGGCRHPARARQRRGGHGGAVEADHGNIARTSPSRWGEGVCSSSPPSSASPACGPPSSRIPGATIPRDAAALRLLAYRPLSRKGAGGSWRRPAPQRPAAVRTTSAIWRSCFRERAGARQQTMPMVRAGCGSPNRTTETEAERASTATAISGMSVMPSPRIHHLHQSGKGCWPPAHCAPACCAHSDCRLGQGLIAEANVPSSSSRRISRNRQRTAQACPPRRGPHQPRNSSVNSGTSVRAGSETGRGNDGGVELPSSSSSSSAASWSRAHGFRAPDTAGSACREKPAADRAPPWG